MPLFQKCENERERKKIFNIVASMPMSARFGWRLELETRNSLWLSHLARRDAMRPVPVLVACAVTGIWSHVPEVLLEPMPCDMEYAYLDWYLCQQVPTPQHISLGFNISNLYSLTIKAFKISSKQGISCRIHFPNPLSALSYLRFPSLLSLFT